MTCLPQVGRQCRKRAKPRAETLGEALKAAAKRREPFNTEKMPLSRGWVENPSAAKNITKGHASERTVVSALRAEAERSPQEMRGWKLWMELGELLLGCSYDEGLETVIEDFNRAKQSFERARAQTADLENRAGALVHLFGGVDA